MHRKNSFSLIIVLSKCTIQKKIRKFVLRPDEVDPVPDPDLTFKKKRESGPDPAVKKEPDPDPTLYIGNGFEKWLFFRYWP